MKNLVLLCVAVSTFGLHAQTNGNDPKPSKRLMPNKIEVFWDTSLNAGDRDVASEIELLQAYLEGLDATNVVVSKFNDLVYDTQSFNCSQGCEALYSYIGNTNYNGASNFSGILQKNASKSDVSMVFTSGVTLFEPLDSRMDIPLFIVNSDKDAPHKYLYELAAATNGAYIDLSKQSKTVALKILNYYVDNSEEIETLNTSDPLYYGVVYNEDKTPIQGAIVRIKNTYKEVQTESNGRYKISANEGDILEISALGMVTKDTVLTQSRKTHIPLVADGELLSEVLVQQKKKEEEKRQTAFGKKSKSEVGYLTQDITKDQINLADVNAYEVLFRQQGIQEYKGALYFTKAISINRTPILIYLDGVPVDPNILKSLDARLIENITQLKTLASTIRYGSLGVGGVVMITTNAQNEGGGLANNGDKALVKGNEYTETIQTLELVSAGIPKSNYVLALEKSTSFEAAKKLYYQQLNYERNNINYYLDAAAYFERWNPSFSNTILSNIAIIAPKNVKALKILAYKYEEKGAFDKARYVYEQLINLQPQDLQSYRDLALIYVETADYELAATLYRQMLFNTIPNVDFTPIEDIVIHEFRNLIMNHKSKINYKGLPSALLAIDFEIDIRIVLEWNHPGSEYDVQVVSPEKKYFSYSHTAFNNRDLLQNEIDAGYYMKEFVIDEGEKGPWIVNIRHSGQHNDQVPLVFKYTQYKNYGTPDETRSVKIIQLDKYQDKLTLDSFVN